MDDLQCPYCPEVRPTWSRLSIHVDGVHGAVSVARRTMDLRNPRRVQTVTASAAASEEAEAVGMPVPAEADTECAASRVCECQPVRLHNDGREVAVYLHEATCPAAEQPEVRQQTPCLCGQPLDLMTDDGESWWAHGEDVPSPCTTPAPAAGMPTQRDRHELAQLLRDNTGRLMKAGHDMAGIREALDAVDARMRKLDAQLTSPSTVRRATLNQVWDRLLEAGQLEAATIVMKMITRVVDDQ